VLFIFAVVGSGNLTCESSWPKSRRCWWVRRGCYRMVSGMVRRVFSGRSLGKSDGESAVSSDGSFVG
jgi:hypothetical protein